MKSREFTARSLLRFLWWGIGPFLLVSCSPVRAERSGDAGEPVADSAIQELELLGSWKIAKEASNPRDLRWASDDSIYLGFELGGVTERRLTEGLPVHRVIIRSRSEAPDVPAILNIATTSSSLQAWAENDAAMWIDRNSTTPDQAHTKRLRGYFDDIDVRGDTVALLGYPTVRHLVESEQSFLWLGDLRSDLEQWRPLAALREDRGELASTPAVGTMGLRLGSLRFLSNGDLLVVPAIKPGVFRFSQSGKLRTHWSQRELEASLLEALGNELDPAATASPMALEARPPSWESGSKYIASQLFNIEDVVPIRDGGAIIVRHGTGKNGAYYLGLLKSVPEWFRLPVRVQSTTDRIRSDFSKANQKLAILVTNRAGKVEDESTLYLVSEP